MSEGGVCPACDMPVLYIYHAEDGSWSFTCTFCGEVSK